MRRYTRRMLLIGGGVGAGAAIAGEALIRDRRSTDRRAPGATEAPSSAPLPPIPRGGVARLAASAHLQFDTFDAFRAGEPTVVEVLGRTHSRLLQWSDPAAAMLSGDIVERWQNPDPSTLVLHLRRGVQWHDRPLTGGRELVVDDVLAHFSRLRNLAQSGSQPALQRAWDYRAIASVTAPDRETIVINTSSPDPFLLNAMAGRVAFLQAPEVVEVFGGKGDERAPSLVAGTGPFVLRTVGSDGTIVLDAHRTGHRPPLLDGMEISQPVDVVDRFIGGSLDEVLTRDRRGAASVRDTAGSDVVELLRFEDSPIISSLFVGAPPWNNLHLRKALSGGLNRLELAQRLFGGRAFASGPVPPVFASFALSESELSRYPGYQRALDSDQKDARDLWEAGGGPALGPVTVDFPNTFDPLYSASSIVCGMLNESLGVTQFRPAVESYTSISARVAAHRYGNGTPALWFGWGPPLVYPDPARVLIDTYRSGGPDTEATGYRSSTIDQMLDGLSAEFDSGRRRAIIGEIQRELLADGGGGVVDWLVQRSELFRPAYLGRPCAPTPFGTEHLDDQTLLNPTEASFGRRAPSR